MASNKKKPPPAAATSRKRGRTSSPAANSTIFAPTARKTAHTYTTAVAEIRNMFLEQASLWKRQAERLNAASTGHEPLLSQQEPWSSLIDERGKPTNVFGEGRANGSDEETRNVEEMKKKIKRTKEWRYERPMEEGEAAAEDEQVEESSTGAKLKSDESSDESSAT